MWFPPTSFWSNFYVRSPKLLPFWCDPFYIVSYYIKWVTASWTHGTFGHFLRFTKTLRAYKRCHNMGLSAPNIKIISDTSNGRWGRPYEKWCTLPIRHYVKPIRVCEHSLKIFYMCNEFIYCVCFVRNLGLISTARVLSNLQNELFYQNLTGLRTQHRSSLPKIDY